MIKTQTILEIRKGDRDYKLLLSPDSPIGEVYDVLSEMRAFCLQKINDAQAAEQPKQEQPKEE